MIDEPKSLDALKMIKELEQKGAETLDSLYLFAHEEALDVRLLALRGILNIFEKDEMGSGTSPGQSGKPRTTTVSHKIELTNAVDLTKLGKFMEKALTESEDFQATLQELDRLTWSNHREIVLDSVLEALENNPNKAIRRHAAVWLKSKVSEIVTVTDEYRLSRRVADVVVSAKENEKEKDVADKIKDCLDEIWTQLNQKNLETIKKQIQSSTSSEQEKTNAIRRLAYVNTLGSRDAMDFLVKEWVGWIENKKLNLVELTADALRFNRYAILPLVDHFVKESRREETRRSAFTSFARVVEQRLGQAKTPEVPEETESAKNLRIRRRIARQLADMSDPRLFEGNEKFHKQIQVALRKQAVPMLARLLPQEDDIEILEDMARILGHTSQGSSDGREAITALARAVVGTERTQNARRKLLDEYYLKPTKQQSELASDILQRAIEEARRNLILLQGLNILVFIVGLLIFFAGFVISVVNEDAATRFASGLASIGGLVGVIYHLVNKPLDRIQSAMANLVQMETAFTSFIWELNLNGTYVQSRYVADGKLTNDEINEASDRGQTAMALTMNMVSVYAETSMPHLMTRINRLEPVSGAPKSTLVIHGQNLYGDVAHHKKERTGIVAFNHLPVHSQVVKDWDDNMITVEIPENIAAEKVWVSLFVDGMETNALPFQILVAKATEEQPDDDGSLPQILDAVLTPPNL